MTGEGVTAKEPALVASYDEDGRFLKLVPLQAPSSDPVEIPDDASSVKIFWIDEQFAPKVEEEEIVRASD